jgi:predicted HicB family RNase H-like nuclease
LRFWQAEPAWEDFMSQTLQYKGYDGSVEYSAEDRVLHGSLLGIRDGVVYEGSDVDSLESNFRAAVDEYLVFCAEAGKTPDRTVTAEQKKL